MELVWSTENPYKYELILASFVTQPLILCSVIWYLVCFRRD